MFQVGKKLTSNFLVQLNSFKILLNMNSLERVMSNNQLAEQMIESLQKEFTAFKNDKTLKKISELKQENEDLKKQVDLAKAQLIQLETAHGKPQIPIAKQGAVAPGAEKIEKKPIMKEEQKPIQIDDRKPPKEKKPKVEKPVSTSAASSAEAPIDIGRIDLRVGKIVEVSKHPDADALYLEKIDLGETNPRTIISGLVKFVPIEEMQNRMVVVMCNLKPVKMRGINSEGMVMCASTPDKVEILSPPAGAVPGDLVHCEGYPRVPDAQLNPKKKIFETVAPDLMTNDNLVACYKRAPLIIPGKGEIMAQTLKNVNVK